MEPWPEDIKPQQPAPAPPAPAPPAPAGLFEMLEDTLTVPFALGKVFVKQALAASPGFGVLSANIAVYAAGFLILLLLRFHLSFPESAARLAPSQHALSLIVGVSFITFLSFIGAGLLQLVSQAAGGRADYQRSYQILSLLALFLPASAAASAFPFGWPALAVFWTYICAVAAENMLQAPGGRARAVFAGVAAVVIGGAWFASVQIDKVLSPYLEIMKIQAQAARQYQDAAAAAALSQRGAGVNASPSAFDAAAQATQLLQNIQQGSSLNLVSGPATPQLPTPEQTAAIVQELQKHPAAAPQFAAQSLGQVLPLLDNPAFTKGMSPEQAKQMKVLGDMMKQMQDNMKAGKPMTPDQQAQIMKAQQNAMQLMLQGMQKPPQAPAPPPQTQQQGGQQ